MTGPQAEVAEFVQIDWRDNLPPDYDSSIGSRLLSIGVPNEDVDGFEQEAKRTLANVRPVDPFRIPFSGDEDTPSVRWRLARQLTNEKKQASLSRTLGDFLSRREFVIEDEEQRQLLCPLVGVSGPRVPGTKVKWVSSSSESTEVNWQLEGFGSGLGSNSRVSVKESVSMPCGAAETKQLAVMVPVRVCRVATLHKGAREGEGLSIEVTRLNAGESLPIDIRTLSKYPKPGDLLTRSEYNLTRDSSAEATTFTVEVQAARKAAIKIGVKHSD